MGQFDFIKLKPDLMREGINWSNTKLSYLIARVEKALLDTLYIGTRKNNRFAVLPELELGADVFDHSEYDRLFVDMPVSSRIKNAVVSVKDRV